MAVIEYDEYKQKLQALEPTLQELAKALSLPKAREELAPIQRQLGQQAAAFADAMNSQNKLGMTLANKLGSDIFTLPTSSGLPDSDNAGTGSISVSFMANSSADEISISP